MYCQQDIKFTQSLQTDRDAFRQISQKNVGLNNDHLFKWWKMVNDNG